MKHLLLLGLLLLSLPLTFGYEITEVMYDPNGIDTDREWIEVYGKPLDEVLFLEDANAHSLTLVQGNCTIQCVSIIADNAQLFLEEYEVNASVLIYDSSWSSLKNTGEYIGLEKNNELLVELFYSAITLPGESLTLVNDSYISAQPTPGFYQIISENEEVNEVPEFGILSSLIVLGIGGFFIFRNRQG